MVVCYRLYRFSDIDSYGAITNEQRRVAFVFRTILVVTTIYLQMGTSVLMKPTTKKASYFWLVLQYLVILCRSYVYVNYGDLFYNVWDIQWRYSDYYEHYYMLVLNSCLAVFFTTVSKLAHHKNA